MSEWLDNQKQSSSNLRKLLQERIEKAMVLPVSAPLAAYQSRLLAHPAVREWYEGALAETIFLDFEEPYRSAVD